MEIKTFKQYPLKAISDFRMLARVKMTRMVTIEEMGDMVLNYKPDIKDKVEKLLSPVKSKRDFLMLLKNRL